MRAQQRREDRARVRDQRDAARLEPGPLQVAERPEPVGHVDEAHAPRPAHGHRPRCGPDVGRQTDRAAVDHRPTGPDAAARARCSGTTGSGTPSSTRSTASSRSSSEGRQGSPSTVSYVGCTRCTRRTQPVPSSRERRASIASRSPKDPGLALAPTTATDRAASIRSRSATGPSSGHAPPGLNERFSHGRSTAPPVWGEVPPALTGRSTAGVPCAHDRAGERRADRRDQQRRGEDRDDGARPSVRHPTRPDARRRRRADRRARAGSDPDRRRGGQRVGTSPALVVYYFATKDELLIEALAALRGRLLPAVEDLLQQPGDARGAAHHAGRPDHQRRLAG